MKRLLLPRVEQIDTRRDDCVHRVGNGEANGQVDEPPRSVLPLEKLSIDQRRQELLDEERVSLRTLDDELAQAWGQRAF